MAGEGTTQIHITPEPKSWGEKVDALSIALQDPTNIAIDMLEIDLTPDPVYLHTAIGDIDYDGKTWLGIGNLGALSETESSMDFAAAEMVAEMSLVNDTATKAALILGNQSGRAVVRHRGVIDPNDGTLITAAPIWYGLFDHAKLTESEERGEVVQCTFTDEMARQSTKRGGTYSDAWQQARHPGDRIFEHVESLDAAPVQWGPRG